MNPIGSSSSAQICPPSIYTRINDYYSQSHTPSIQELDNLTRELTTAPRQSNYGTAQQQLIELYCQIDQPVPSELFLEPETPPAVSTATETLFAQIQAQYDTIPRHSPTELRELFILKCRLQSLIPTSYSQDPLYIRINNRISRRPPDILPEQRLTIAVEALANSLNGNVLEKAFLYFTVNSKLDAVEAPLNEFIESLNPHTEADRTLLETQLETLFFEKMSTIYHQMQGSPIPRDSNHIRQMLLQPFTSNSLPTNPIEIRVHKILCTIFFPRGLPPLIFMKIQTRINDLQTESYYPTIEDLENLTREFLSLRDPTLTEFQNTYTQLEFLYSLIGYPLPSELQKLKSSSHS